MLLGAKATTKRTVNEVAKFMDGLDKLVKSALVLACNSDLGKSRRVTREF